MQGLQGEVLHSLQALSAPEGTVLEAVFSTSVRHVLLLLREVLFVELVLLATTQPLPEEDQVLRGMLLVKLVLGKDQVIRGVLSFQPVLLARKQLLLGWIIQGVILSLRLRVVLVPLAMMLLVQCSHPPNFAQSRPES